MSHPKKVLIEVNLEEFDSLDYVGKADLLIAKVEKARVRRI